MNEKEKAPQGGERQGLIEFVGYVKRRLISEDCFDEKYPEEYRARLKTYYETMFDSIIDALESPEK